MAAFRAWRSASTLLLAFRLDFGGRGALGPAKHFKTWPIPLVLPCEVVRSLWHAKDQFNVEAPQVSPPS